MLIKSKLQIPSQKCVILGAELSGPCEKDQNLLTQETQRSLKLYVLPLKVVFPWMFPEGKVREEVQGDVAGPGNTCLPQLCPGQPSPRLPCWSCWWLERKHGRLHERTCAMAPPLCAASCPCTDRVGGFMLFCRVITITLEGHPESFLITYTITAFLEH